MNVVERRPGHAMVSCLVVVVLEKEVAMTVNGLYEILAAMTVNEVVLVR